MENQQLQQQPIDTRVKATKKGKKREFKNRKTFSLKAMEALVDKVSFLKNKYDTLAVNAQEKLGYHYNEILNILLFHKYVKSKPKLFSMYKKIKDAINKGYEFDKVKKLEESTMKKNAKNNKSTHFAIDKRTNKILESWNYEGHDIEDLKNYKNEYFKKTMVENHPNINMKDVKIVAKNNLLKEGLNPDNKNDWQKYNYTHFALLKEFNQILCGYNYSNISQEELSKNKKEFFLEQIMREYGNEVDPKDVKIVKAEKIKNPLNKSNWVGLISEAYCGPKKELKKPTAKKLSNKKKEEIIDESTDVGSVFGAEGMPVANPYMRPKKGFSMKKNQDMWDAENMLPSVKKSIERLQDFAHPVFKKGKKKAKGMKVNYATGIVHPNTNSHEFGGGPNVKYPKKPKTIDEGLSLIDLEALMNDEIEYVKLDNQNKNPFKSTKPELIRENNRDSIIEFLVKYQGHHLPEVYNKRQFNNMALKTLNEHYAKVVDRLGLMNEEAKPKALVNIAALNKQTQNDSNNYYKKDASNKTTTMLVQKGEGDGLVYDKDSLQRKDIPKYKYQSEHQQEYLKKITRGLQDFQPENGPNGEVDPEWLARKEALMSNTEAGKEAFKNAQNRIKAKQDYKIGTNKAVLLQKDLPKVSKADKVLKESSFNLIKETNILDQVQSFYLDEDNRKKPVIFDSNDIITMVSEEKLMGCKELTYKGLGQTLSEDFKNKVLNKKLLYSPDSKKVYLV